jgi:hypothetical protein
MMGTGEILRTVGFALAIAGVAVGMPISSLRGKIGRRGFLIGLFVALVGVVVVVVGSYFRTAGWSAALKDGKELTYLWRYKDGAKELRGEFLVKATGKEREIDGRTFTEVAFDWREVPLTAGVYYYRVSEDGIETVTVGPHGEGKPEKVLEFPIEEGREWKFAGAAYAKILRTNADFTDASGKVWKGCVCVGIYNGPKALGEMWFQPEIGSLASKMFFSNLGYNEQILKCVK